MYKSKKPKQRRPNARKAYEEHHQVKVPKNMEVHHKLPIRLGGTNDISNLEVLTWEEHRQAHLDLYHKYGDPRDLCAYYMLCGRSEEARFVASSMGGKAAAKKFKEEGIPTGFQAFSEEKRKAVATKAGKAGGAACKRLKLGIHAHTKEEKIRVRILGGTASAIVNGFNDPERQASRGRRGGVKNAGSRFYTVDGKILKYTASMAKEEPFESFIARTGFTPGKGKMPAAVGAKYYNDGNVSYRFLPSQHQESFEEFLMLNGFQRGRVDKSRDQSETPNENQINH